MEMCTKETGSMIKPTGSEFMFMSMVLAMKEIGRMIFNMAKVVRVGQMEVFMKANI
jgi:hypothetical protein